MNDQVSSTDPVQEMARAAFKEWEPHLHKRTPFEVAGILNDIECKYVGERHEDFCKTLHFLAFEYYMKPERLRERMLHTVTKHRLTALRGEFEALDKKYQYLLREELSVAKVQDDLRGKTKSIGFRDEAIRQLKRDLFTLQATHDKLRSGVVEAIDMWPDSGAIRGHLRFIIRDGGGS